MLRIGAYLDHDIEELIHLENRCTFYSSATLNPTGDWVMQQAHNALMWLEDEGVMTKYPIHDGDRKFPARFEEFWKKAGVRPIKTPPKAPRANAFMEPALQP